MTTPKRQSGSRGGAPGRHRANSEPAVAALRMEELTLWVIQHVTKMPKAHKFTLGEGWLETCLDVTALLVDASFTRDKHPLLAKAACGLTRARLLARLHHERANPEVAR